MYVFAFEFCELFSHSFFYCSHFTVFFFFHFISFPTFSNCCVLDAKPLMWLIQFHIYSNHLMCSFLSISTHWMQNRPGKWQWYTIKMDKLKLYAFSAQKWRSSLQLIAICSCELIFDGLGANCFFDIEMLPSASHFGIKHQLQKK